MRFDSLRAHPQAVRGGSSAALLLVGVLVAYGWILAPHLNCLHAMQKLEVAVGRVSEEKERIAGTLEAKVRQRHALQEELAQCQQGVFPADQARTFLRSLLPLVEETGCTVVTADFIGKDRPVRIEDPNGPLVIEADPVSLEVEGPSERIQALLQRLRDHRPKIWVDSCQVDFPAQDSGPLACHLALTFYTVTNRNGPAGE